MFSTKITTIALVAMFSATSLAAAVPNTMNTAPIQLDTRDWVSVDFKGKTIEYNPAAFNASSEDIENMVPAKRGDNNDYCGDSSYSGTEAPWPNESDCATLGDWVSRENKYYDVWANTPDFHGIIRAGTCVFGAGTKNFLGAKIGSTDISAAISESISRFAVCCASLKNSLAKIFMLMCRSEQRSGRCLGTNGLREQFRNGRCFLEAPVHQGLRT